MSLEKIVEKIIADARAEAEQIILETRARAEGIKKAAQEEAEKRAAAFLQEAEREARLQAGRIVTQARLEKRMKILLEKRALLEQVLTRAMSAEVVGRRKLKKKVVAKEGERAEEIGREQLFEELRSRLEKDILDALKI
jgi:vacuolar-type H+-ATPase subunit H